MTRLQPLERLAPKLEIESHALDHTLLRSQVRIQFAQAPLAFSQKSFEPADLCPRVTSRGFGPSQPGLQFPAQGIKRFDLLEPLGAIRLGFIQQSL